MPFCDFEHRVEVQEIKRIIIEGDVELKEVILSTKDKYPNIEPPKITFPVVCFNPFCFLTMP